MAKGSKERDVSLLQRSPDRDDLFLKMREALLLGMHMGSPVSELRKQETRTRGREPWWSRGARLARIAPAAAVLVAGVFMIMQKDNLLARFGYESVPSLPTPRVALGTDEQALYWTYALFDIRKLRSRFGIQGFYAVDAIRARRNLDGLLPSVSPAVLGEISAYTPVAFRSLAAGDHK